MDEKKGVTTKLFTVYRSPFTVHSPFMKIGHFSQLLPQPLQGSGFLNNLRTLITLITRKNKAAKMTIHVIISCMA